MADEPDNLVLALLRKMSAENARLLELVTDTRDRVAALETEMASSRADVAQVRIIIVRVEHRIDDLDKRVARIETRLGLIEA